MQHHRTYTYIDIAPVEGEQFHVASTFYNTAIFNDVYHVGVLDGRQPVCDGNRRSAFGRLFERLLHRSLGLGIKCLKYEMSINAITSTTLGLLTEVASSSY
jgi:hypothetical protein